MVRDVLDGRTDDFRVLVDRHADRLYSHLCRMVGQEQLASELLQQTLIRAYERLDQCREPDRVSGWMFRIASNLCKDHLKRRDQDNVGLDDAPPLEAAREEPDAAAEREELRASLEEALGQLSTGQREAFLMKHLEGYTYEEMAEHLGVGVSAAKMRVHRAREDLQAFLEGEQ